MSAANFNEKAEIQIFQKNTSTHGTLKNKDNIFSKLLTIKGNPAIGLIIIFSSV